MQGTADSSNIYIFSAHRSLFYRQTHVPIPALTWIYIYIYLYIQSAYLGRSENLFSNDRSSLNKRSLRRTTNSDPPLMHPFHIHLNLQAHKLRSPLEVFPLTYKKFFVNPVSFESLAQCIRNGAYQSTDEFLSEVKWIQHNALILDAGGECNSIENLPDNS